MKKILLVAIILLNAGIIYSQASNYFPASTGYKWYYKETPLDSLNNPITSASTYRIDSFAVNNVMFHGYNAAKVVSKSGLITQTQPAPYNDTAYYSFQSNDAYNYLRILPGLDSIPILQQIGLIAFLKGMENWYNVYRFNNAVNTNYTIVTKDTTFTYDTLTLPIRITMTGRRLNDENVSTVVGTFLSKKFLFTYNLSYLILIPPLPPIPITLVQIPETTYVANNIWMVKNVRASANVNLSQLGFPITFSVPGTMTELTTEPSGISNIGSTIATSFVLKQNYPNPFNPMTKIKFIVPANVNGQLSNVRLVVYDVSGKLVSELVNARLNSGEYEVDFNAVGLASGTYFYELQANNFRITRKMVLQK
ncbi:MAG TPA: T9SS type A sorting domain-containing protein [Ignavibacteria bacterium]|nr:T9SS type A sorting domain-containing protein [Ignavibacteria bacterium]